MLVILDRDGVINVDSDAYIKSPEEWQPITGSIEAIATLTQAGHTVVVATNQSGVGRGLFSLDMLNAMHAKMQDLIIAAGGKIDGIYSCLHHPDAGCQCRKPKPGMLLEILHDYDERPENCLLVGDSLRDLQAGAAIGCQLALVKTGKGLKTLKEVDHFPGLMVYDDLQSIKVD